MKTVGEDIRRAILAGLWMMKVWLLMLEGLVLLCE